MLVDDEWQCADRFRAELDAMKLPPALRQQISFRHAQPRTGETTCLWPPRPGSCSPPGLGSARIWGDFGLAAWIEAGAAVLGPTTQREAAVLDGIAGRLRRGGEGARTLWALDLLHPWQWRSYPQTAFAPNALVCFGPHLDSATIADVDSMFAEPTLAECGWCRIAAGLAEKASDGANGQGMWNRVRCYTTTWVSDTR